MIDLKRSGSGLFKCWAFASVVYVLVAGALSIEPARDVITDPQDVSRANPMPQTRVTGPLPEAPNSRGEEIARVIAKQAGICLAPPLLALWFGWDVWFATVGFLSRDRHDGKEVAGTEAELPPD